MLPALCSTERSPNVISQQDLATCAYCFPHKYSSVAWQNYVYVPYTLLINSLIREPGTKKATNGLKRDKNGLILCNVSLMEVLAPFFGIKKTLPPLLQKLYDGDGILRYSSIRGIFSFSQEAHKAELRLRLYALRSFSTSLLH